MAVIEKWLLEMMQLRADRLKTGATHLHEVDLALLDELWWEKVHSASRELEWGANWHGGVKVRKLGNIPVHQDVLCLDVAVNEHLRLVQIAKPSRNSGQSFRSLQSRVTSGFLIQKMMILGKVACLPPWRPCLCPS